MKKLLFALLGFSLICKAIAKDIPIKENIDYTVISAPAKAVPGVSGKVNVTEFFSYACVHCSLLEPILDQWLGKVKNINFNQIQVVWDNNFLGYAKISATAQMLKLGSGFNQLVFKATMEERQDLENPANLKNFLAKQKIVDPKKFMATYNSFTISTKPQEYAQYTQAYNITATPIFVVANKYMTEPAQPDKLIQVVQALVDKAKLEQKIK